MVCGPPGGAWALASGAGRRHHDLIGDRAFDGQIDPRVGVVQRVALSVGVGVVGVDADERRALLLDLEVGGLAGESYDAPAGPGAAFERFDRQQSENILPEDHETFTSEHQQ